MALGLNEFIPQSPTVLQMTGLLAWHKEAGLYGGAAGPGKSSYLLMEVLRDPWIRIQGYSALIMRRHRKDLYLPEGILDRAKDWLKPAIQAGRVKWNLSTHGYDFLEHGSRVIFGYADDDKALDDFAGSAYQCICIDEAGQFSRRQLGILGSRLRKLNTGPLADIAMRYRLASNPGGIGHDYLQEEYVEAKDRSNKWFLPGTLADNPHIDAASYERGLRLFLDPITLKRLLNGDWSAREGGGWFVRTNFVILDEPPDKSFVAGDMRYWDLAGTEEKIKGDPDYTVGVHMQRLKNHDDLDAVILDVERRRENPGPIERLVVQTAQIDGKGVSIRIEQEPGQSGKAQIDRFCELLVGYDCAGDKSTGPKDVRARPFSAAVNRKRIGIVRGAWNKLYLDELEGFPGNTVHDDQVDGSSGAFNLLTEGEPGMIGWMRAAADKGKK